MSSARALPAPCIDFHEMLSHLETTSNEFKLVFILSTLDLSSGVWRCSVIGRSACPLAERWLLRVYFTEEGGSVRKAWEQLWLREVNAGV